MKTVVAMAGQTLADIAIQECGALEAVCDIAQINGLSVSSLLPDGAVLRLPDRTYNVKMESYCSLNKVRPATEVLESDCGVFTKVFTKEFT